MEADYPAAHSMDTSWFAVDRDGFVALFDTGEAGAMPVDAASADDLWDELEELPVRGEIIYDPTSFELETEAGRHDTGSEGQRLMFLASEDPIRADLDAGRATRVLVTRGVGVKWKALSPERDRELHKTGLCLGCEDDWRETAERGEDPRRFQFFTYGHAAAYENWISGPYIRETLPGEPLRLDELPAELADEISRLRLNEVSFAEETLLQPAEYVHCESWQPGWVSCDGKTVRPFSGKEAEFEGYVSGLQADFENVDLAPALHDQSQARQDQRDLRTGLACMAIVLILSLVAVAVWAFLNWRR